eukprot:scaffold3505_cov170-Amphora_coffeaeformis.AAC.9
MILAVRSDRSVWKYFPSISFRIYISKTINRARRMDRHFGMSMKLEKLDETLLKKIRAIAARFTVRNRRSPVAQSSSQLASTTNPPHASPLLPASVGALDVAPVFEPLARERFDPKQTRWSRDRRAAVAAVVPLLTAAISCSGVRLNTKTRRAAPAPSRKAAPKPGRGGAKSTFRAPPASARQLCDTAEQTSWVRRSQAPDYSFVRTSTPAPLADFAVQERESE